MITRLCLTCKKVFKVWPYRLKEGRGKYCSKECFNRKPSKKEVKKCLDCNINLKSYYGKRCRPCEAKRRWREKLWNLKSWNKGTKGIMKPNSGSFKKGAVPWSKGKKYKTFRKSHPQTKESRIKISNALKGENSYLWKGGATTKNKIIRCGIEFRLWREAVFARDNFTCQKCLEKGGKLQSHHILNFAKYPELRFAIDNGITFCKKCHKKFHKIYNNRNNTKEQLKEYLYG